MPRSTSSFPPLESQGRSMPREGDKGLSQIWFSAGSLGCKPCISVWTMSSAWIRGSPQPGDKTDPMFWPRTRIFPFQWHGKLYEPGREAVGERGGWGGGGERESHWPYAQCGNACRPALSLLPPLPLPVTYFLSCFLANYYSASIFQFVSLPGPFKSGSLRYSFLHHSNIITCDIWKYLYLRVYLFNVCPC